MVKEQREAEGISARALKSRRADAETKVRRADV